ncbi:MAG: NAD(P)H-dependent oxidoreductase subunit E [Planctomycetes bacterium]|nr:NAD(P)H-dependent oxidoreductase subunit E [Planctomycetota bacterium]
MSAAACVNPATIQPKDLTVDQVRERMKKYQPQIDELWRRYPVKRAVLLQVLWLLQEEYRWVPRVGIEWAAEVSAVSAAHAYGVVEFYTMYKQVPSGRYLIQVCQTMCCLIQGSEDLIAHLEKKLGIHSGETTSDGMFTLVRVECLALCGTGPGVMINDEAIGPEKFEILPDGFHPRAADLDRWLDRLRADASSQPQWAVVDPLGGIVLNTKGHPGAVGAAAQAQRAGYAPAPPALKVAAVATGDAIAVTWANAPECTKLVVERSDDGGATWRELASVGPKDQKTADKLADGHSAHYRVIAHEKDRVAKPSAVVAATGKPQPPPAPQPGVGSAPVPGGTPSPSAATPPPGKA